LARKDGKWNSSLPTRREGTQKEGGGREGNGRSPATKKKRKEPFFDNRQKGGGGMESSRSLGEWEKKKRGNASLERGVSGADSPPGAIPISGEGRKQQLTLLKKG